MNPVLSTDKQALFDKVHNRIFECVKTAANMSHDIRRQADVVYYFTPVFKHEEFDPSRMVCANLKPTQDSCPLIEEEGEEANDLNGDSDSIAMVKVVCFHGITAYRSEGGEAGKRWLQRQKELDVIEARETTKGNKRWDEPPEMTPHEIRERRKRNRKEVGLRDGIRSKVLAKGIVALSWGLERKMKKDKIDGEDDGYMELVDVVREGLQKDPGADKDGGCVMA